MAHHPARCGTPRAARLRQRNHLHAARLGIASTATLLDITGVANTLYTRTYEPFAPFLTAAVIYLAITLCIVGIFRRIEKRLNRHL